MHCGVAGQFDRRFGTDVDRRRTDQECERSRLGDAPYRRVVERESTRRDVEGDRRGFAGRETNHRESDQLAVWSRYRSDVVTTVELHHFFAGDVARVGDLELDERPTLGR